MAASVFWPTGSAIYTASHGRAPVQLSGSFITDSALGYTYHGATLTVPQVQLYLPFTVATAEVVDAYSLVATYGSVTFPSPTVYKGTAASPIATGLQSIPLHPSTTLYVQFASAPFASVNAQPFMEALNANSAAAVTPLTSSQVSKSTESHSRTSATTTATGSTTPASSTATDPSGGKGGDTVSTAALGGGIVGGFVLGLILCALAGFCFLRRRKTQRKSTRSDSGDSSHESALAVPSNHEKAPRTIVANSEVTGWQKHLPQEKDDGHISNSFKSVFEQVRIHVEGYYEPQSGSISSAEVEQAKCIVPFDSLPWLLLQKADATTILEAILERWMIHRISGRSSVDDSFLPLELSSVLKKNDWHMERDRGGNGASTEARKGFPQAFSQWRRLTGFLNSTSKTDTTSSREQKLKIENAVQAVVEAFSPWEIPGKSEANRRESLRQILKQASEAGTMLFTQPSTFMFDWSDDNSGQKREVVVAPALIKRLDESAAALLESRVLIAAKSVKVQRE